MFTIKHVRNENVDDDDDDNNNNNNNIQFGTRLSTGVTSCYWDMLDKCTQLLVLSIASS